MNRGYQRFIQRLPLLPDRPWLSYPVAIGISVLCLLARIAVDRLLPPGFPFVTFFPGVIVTSFLFGVGPGLVSASISGIFAWYFFVDPNHSNHFSPAIVVAMVFYTVVVAVDIALVYLMQRANFHLAVERKKTEALAETRAILFR